MNKREIDYNRLLACGTVMVGRIGNSLPMPGPQPSTGKRLPAGIIRGACSTRRCRDCMFLQSRRPFLQGS